MKIYQQFFQQLFLTISYKNPIEISKMQDYPSRYRQGYSNYDQVLTNGRRSYNFSNMQKSIQISQTDKRIQEIKRKYDTPNRRERISQLSVKKSDTSNKENDNYGTADFKTKIPITITQTEGSEAGLRESKAISNSRQSFFNNQSSGSKSFLAGGIYRDRQSYDSKLQSSKLYTNQNQEQFFKRVKQMKQSLLYGDNAAKQTEMKNSTFYPTKESRNRSGFYQSNQTIEKDRIDNIDKINQKIKGILECLNQNEKTRIPSKYDAQKRSKMQNIATIEQQPKINIRQIARTPIKNAISSSIMGRQSFGNHRHERSEILDKIQINRDFKDQVQNKQQKPAQDDDKWEKLSTKIQKYELQNKLRIQKAFDFSKQVNQQTSSTQNIAESIRKERYGYKQQNEFKRSTQHVRRDNRSMDLRDLRSRSFLNTNVQTSKDIRDRSLHSKELTGTKEYEMKSGKKLDDQIGRIQKKIQQFQEDKKRLNINFKPFNYSNTKSTSNLNFYQPTRNQSSLNDPSDRKISEFNRNSSNNQISLNCQSKQNLRQEFDRLQNQQTFRQKKNYQQHQNFHDGSFNRLDSKIEIKLQKSNPSSVRTSKFISHGSSRVSNEGQQQEESFRLEREPNKHSQEEKKVEKQYKYVMDQNLKKQTDDGIEERRKKLMSFSEGEIYQNAQLKTLVKSLCDQVQVDQEFRNAKIWYEYNSDPKKQNQIKKLLPKRSIEQIRQILKVKESQNNPFFTTQGYESSFQTLVDLYNKSEGHWNNQIYRKFKKNSLQSQGFTSREIDLEKKGHINLGDLVRFLNLQSGTFYRNRDLSLVFIRIAKEHNSSSYTEVSFQQMQSTFCH